MSKDDERSEFDLTQLVNTANAIHGADLSLIWPVEAHVQTLVALANNIKVASQTATMPHPYTADHARAWIAEAARQDDKRAFVIILKSDPLRDQAEIVGGCSFGPPPSGYSGVQIGYWLGEAYWGQGYAAEACHMLIDHIFTKSTVDSIWVTCRVANARSRRVIEKCGFQFRESALEMSTALQAMQSVERFVLDRRIWESLKAWGRTDQQAIASNQGPETHL